MTRVAWDGVGEKFIENGVSRGVLFPVGDDGEYADGVPWNGLTTVTESPSGAESNKQYADNIVYANLLSAELFGGTIEAFAFPREFYPCDGAVVVGGVVVGQQPRKAFGFCFRTEVGSDASPTAGYKIKLAWGCLASPSEQANATVNDSPEAKGFSWEFSSTPVSFTEEDYEDMRPTALLTIPSLDVDSDALAALEAIIYGDDDNDPRMPTPDEVLDLFSAGSLTDVDMSDEDNKPTIAAHVVTLPTVTGVQWKKGNANVADGAQPALTAGQKVTYRAAPLAGYVIEGDDKFSFEY